MLCVLRIWWASAGPASNSSTNKWLCERTINKSEKWKIDWKKEEKKKKRSSGLICSAWRSAHIRAGRAWSTTDKEGAKRSFLVKKAPRKIDNNYIWSHSDITLHRTHFRRTVMATLHRPVWLQPTSRTSAVIVSYAVYCLTTDHCTNMPWQSVSQNRMPSVQDKTIMTP